jgi:hypothetical protein
VEEATLAAPHGNELRRDVDNTLGALARGMYAQKANSWLGSADGARRGAGIAAMTLRRLVLIAPLLFVVHVAEEAPGFVEWFNSLVPRGITLRLFLTVNGVALAITLVVVLFAAASPGVASALTLTAWIGFLMLANGLFHVVGTLAHLRYCPGVITGSLLYLPYGALLLRQIVRDRLLPLPVALGATALGATPMLIHGYLIIFRASRLF